MPEQYQNMSKLSSHTVDKSQGAADARHDMRHTALAARLAYNAANGIFETMQDTMIAVGYSKTMARTGGQRVLQSASFREVAASMGLDRSAVARVVQDAMRANVVAVHKGVARETDAPDHKTRLAAASLFGDFTGEKKTVIENRNVNVDVSGTELLELLGMNNS